MNSRKWVITVAMAAAVAMCAQEAFAKAFVFEYMPGIAQVYANAIAQEALPSTLPVTDWLYSPTYPGDGSCVPNGVFVRADDLEFNLFLTPRNWGQASARYNVCGDPRKRWTAIYIENKADAGAPSRGGFGVAAVGDTAVSDSFGVDVNPTGATTGNVVVTGQIVIQRLIAAPGVGRVDVLVYPDSTVANLDPTRSGAGAVFRGRLIVDKDGIEKADGNWSASDFQVTITADKVRVRANGFTKGFTAPSTTRLASYLAADGSSHAVPASSPLAVGILSTLMLGAGYMVLRRRRVEA